MLFTPNSEQKTMLHYLSVCSGNSYDDLKILLNAISDPFLARKQLCRTPESLSTSLLIFLLHLVFQVINI